jgi:hypothetical protein
MGGPFPVDEGSVLEHKGARRRVQEMRPVPDVDHLGAAREHEPAPVDDGSVLIEVLRVRARDRGRARWKQRDIAHDVAPGPDHATGNGQRMADVVAEDIDTSVDVAARAQREARDLAS